MAVLLHHPDQRPDCLRGLVARSRQWAAQDRERFLAFGTFHAFGTWLRSLGFREDPGAWTCRDGCCPGQRERRWAPDPNCWERVAYVLAAGSLLLPRDFVLHIRDYDSGGGGRHIEPIEFDVSRGASGPLPSYVGSLETPDLSYQNDEPANRRDPLSRTARPRPITLFVKESTW